MWPDEVAGAALVLERLVLPPSAEESLVDDDPEALEAAAAAHPDRQDVRMAVVVTRDGRPDVRAAAAVARRRRRGPRRRHDLVPRLADALAATFV